MHAGRHEQQQRLLLTQLLPETLNHLRTLVGSLEGQHVVLKPSRLPADVEKVACAEKYLLLLKFTANVRDFDLQGIQLLIWYLRNREWLHLLGTLEGELCQGDAPLTVVLLVLPARGGGAWTRPDKNTGRQVCLKEPGGYKESKLLLSLTLQFVS